MKVMRYTGGHVDHRTGPGWPVFVTDSQRSGTSSNKIDLILDMRLLVVNRPLRPRGDRQARPRGPEEVVECRLRTVESVKHSGRAKASMHPVVAPGMRPPRAPTPHGDPSSVGLLPCDEVDL